MMLTYSEFLTHWDGPQPHVFLCQPNKAPMRSGWQCQPATPAQADAHTLAGGLLGLIPFSLGYTVMDVDAGQPLRLADTPPPHILQPTQRRRGAHLYYRDDTPRKNSKWTWRDCSGEVRSANGFVIAWPGLWARLLEAQPGWSFWHDGSPDVPYEDLLAAVTATLPPPPKRRPSQGALLLG